MKKRILIVEDNEINRAVLSHIVSMEYEVIEAANGQEALNVLEKQYARIALILLDIAMPVMDGYTFMEEKKKNRNFSSIPVIVTTEQHSEEAEIAALSSGATEFVVKPYQPKIIMHRISSILKLRETSAMVDSLQYDRLTGLYSKDYFYQYARELRAQNPDKKYDFICTNVENFHLFNDRYGTETGDSLLQTIADLYKNMLPEGMLVASRFYADYFVGMMEHRPEINEEYFLKIQEYIQKKMCGLSVTLRWGIYTDNGVNMPIEKMCDNAALAARFIRGQYGVYFGRFDQNLRDCLEKEQEIIDEMEQALEEEQFEVYLQPKVRSQFSEWRDAESLVRWNHPKKGMMSPAVFIPVFEKTHFIAKLDRYVWKKTCEILCRWKEMGLGEIHVSVNMSRADIVSEDIVEYLEGLVRQYQISPSQLHLEITETACTDHPEEVIRLAGQLRKKGFMIEMDDFGSGYSSLNMLMQMPLDVLKLDRELIQNEMENKGALKYIVDLAHWMKLKVVAEGVETQEQMNYMVQLGCDYVQGYCMAKPMHWKEFEKRLTEQTVLK